MNRDVLIENIPEGYYFDGRNLVSSSIKGDTFSISNERSHELFSDFHEKTNQFRAILHMLATEKYIIVFSCQVDNWLNIVTLYSEIGVINKETGIYTVVVNDAGPQNLGTERFNFDLRYTIQSQFTINYKGETIVYWVDSQNLPRFINIDKNYLIEPFQNLSQQTSLQPYSNYATPKFAKINDYGRIKIGAYQAAIQYSNDKIVYTDVQFISTVVPVTPHKRSVPRNEYDGGGLSFQEVNKSITFTVENLDQNYKYYRPVIIRYEGQNNQPVVLALEPELITTTTQQFTFSGRFEEQLTVQELLQSPVFYANAKSIIQQDNYLLLANLTRNDPVDIQPIANRLILKYVIKEIEWDEDKYSGFKLEEVTSALKTLARNENYSFGLMGETYEGEHTFVAHIPGQHAVNTPANTVTKELGTYVSTDKYEVDNYYYDKSGVIDPTTNLFGKGIRHHTMPRLSQEAHYRVDPATGKTYLRIIGVEVANLQSAVDAHPEIKSKIKRYYICRQQRNDSELNRSVFGQGFLQKMLKTTQIVNSNKKFHLPGDSYQINPLYGQTEFNPSFVPSFGFISTNAVNAKKQVAFICPEFLFSSNYNIPGNCQIQSELFMAAETNEAQFQKDSSTNSALIHHFANFKQAPNTYDIVQNNILNSFPVGFNDAPIDKGSYEMLKTARDAKLNNYDNEGFYYLNLENEIDEPAGNTGTIISGINGAELINVPNFIIKNYWVIKSKIKNQYGKLNFNKFIIMGELVDNLPVFNGDNFITKFSYNISTKIPYYSSSSATEPLLGPKDYLEQRRGLQTRVNYYYFVESFINTDFRHQEIEKDTLGNIIATGPSYFPKKDIKVVLQNEPEFGNSNGYNIQYSFDNSIKPYYLKPDVFEEVSKYENRIIYAGPRIEGESSESYRLFKALNYQDIPKHKGPITKLFALGNELYCHTTRSTWRLFFNTVAQQSAGDISEVILGTSGLLTIPPKEILSLSSGYAGCLHINGTVTTPWGQLFVDYEQRKVFLFNGELTEISKLGMGKWFNSYLEPLKMPSNLNTEYFIPTYFDAPQSPLANSILCYYDPELNRALITLHLIKPDKTITSNNDFILNSSESKFKLTQETISFDFTNQAWLSFHDYFPKVVCQDKNKFYLSANELPVSSEFYNKIYVSNSFNNGYCKLIDKNADQYITVVVNLAQLETKVFDNLEVLADFFTLDSSNLKYDSEYSDITKYIKTSSFFDSLELIGEHQYRQVNLQTNNSNSFLNNYRYINNEYRVTLPKVSTINSSLNPYENSNQQTSFNSLLSRFKGKYLLIKLKKNSKEVQDFWVLKKIIAYFRQNAR